MTALTWLADTERTSEEPEQEFLAPVGLTEIRYHRLPRAMFVITKPERLRGLAAYERWCGRQPFASRAQKACHKTAAAAYTRAFILLES